MRLLVQTFWATPRSIQLKKRATLANELTPLNIGSRVTERRYLPVYLWKVHEEGGQGGWRPLPLLPQDHRHQAAAGGREQ